MLANIQNRKAFLVNLSDDGKMHILGQVPMKKELDLSDKNSMDSVSLGNLSNDRHYKKKVFKPKKNRSKSPKMMKVKKGIKKMMKKRSHSKDL